MIDRPTRRRDLAMPPVVLEDWRERRRLEFFWLAMTMMVVTCAAFSLVLWIAL
jgi:hypothetical protein